MKKFLLCTPGKFHYFDLANALNKNNQLSKIITGYPLFKIKKFNIPNHLIKSSSLYQILYRFFLKIGFRSQHFYLNQIIWNNFLNLDKIASRYENGSDIFLSLSGAGLDTGKRFRKAGKIYICERASSHIRFVSKILKIEYKKFKINFELDKRIVNREIKEYKAANIILVPSRFVQKTFESEGIFNTKIITFPSDNKIFYYKKKRNFYANNFKIIFVGGLTLRKGVHYLLDAFNNLKFQNKELHLVGSLSNDFKLFKNKLLSKNIFVHGHKSHAKINDLLNNSNVFVMPSLEEGAAISVAQAMNTGLPVIVTENTGWKENVQKYKTGYVVKPMNASSIQNKLQYLNDNRSKLEFFSKNALKFSKNRSWDNYVKDLNKIIRNI